VRAALASRCSRLFSEDLQPGRRFYGLEVVNPFA
jgi:predicted nucleic acid-binding protein